MLRRIPLFTVFGVTTSISPLGLVSTLAVIPLLAWLAARQTNLSLGQALVAGTLATLGTVISDWLHQMGHARAARATGYPMIGIHYFFATLSASRYPANEPPLPPRIHIRRALGGFWVNLLIGVLLAPYAMFAWIQGGLAGWLLAFTAIVNFFVLGLGALLPIDIPGFFTIDGGTLWRYWRAAARKA